MTMSNGNMKSKLYLQIINSYVTITIHLFVIILTLDNVHRCHSTESFMRQYHTIPSRLARPKFTILPSDQEVELGARVQLKCSGEASPQPMLFWYKEGHRQLMFPQPPPSSSSNHPSQKNKQLFTPPIPSALSATDSEDWQLPQAAALVAHNSNIDHRYNSNNNNNNNNNNNHGLGSPMMQNAQTSDISPAINKLFSMPVDGSQPFGHTANRYVDSQGTLHILNATSSDNGYYACALISPVGSTLTKAKVTVKGTFSGPLAPSEHYDPLMSSQDPNKSFQPGSGVGKFDLLPPPVIKFGAANQTLPTDSSASLNCDVVSQVAYKIQWFFENQPLQEDPPRVTVLESGALDIKNLTTGDSGIYTCVVTAANDPLMPLASPFEPLDTSMLTTAPPILQQTSHSSMLKVASILNPSIPFFRMDPFKFPSSPGPAYLVSTEGNDAIKIAWPAPSDSGSLPINEYVVEHYDTSNEHSGWKVIHRSKAKESLHIDGLSPEGSHFFVIRAANRHGIGPSSAIAGPMRSVAGEARYQAELQRRRYPGRGSFDGYTGPDSRADAIAARDRLMSVATNLISLTPMSSTSIKLRWSIHLNNNNTITSPMDSPGYPSMVGGGSDADYYVEGYSIRYRATGPGESPLGKEPLFGSSWGSSMPQWPSKDIYAPSSLPLITSFVEGEERQSDPLINSRSKRDLMNIFDYSTEFNEVRVADHTTEHYTINNLRPYTSYQFFVVPYYKDIDGVPSNFLTAQTNEDRPSISPPYLTVRPINDTAVRLLWLHIPEYYTNGILRGYVIRLNRSDTLESGQQQHPGTSLEPPKILNLPIGSLNAVPLPLDIHNNQRYIVMYDVTNLAYKSFYSVQVAGTTSVDLGPWSESQNFVMDPKEMAQSISKLSTTPGGEQQANEWSDVISKSLINAMPQSHHDNALSGRGVSSSIYIIISTSLVISSIILVVGYLLYRRNNQKVLTWKKTISDHFSHKFYMPANVTDPRDPMGPPANGGVGTMPHHLQNIYDHQQNLIYSGSTHLVQQPIQIQATGAQQTMWPNGSNYVNSSGTGSLSSHGLNSTSINNGMAPPTASNMGAGNNDPNMIAGGTRRFATTNDRFVQQQKQRLPLLQNNQASASNVGGMGPPLMEIARPTQIIQHGTDYYSVIDDYDTHQRANMHLASVANSTSNNAVDCHQQSASSNSDTSCPSSVTRLLPNHGNYATQTYSPSMGKSSALANVVGGQNGGGDMRSHEMIMQQQVIYREGGRPFVSIVNGGAEVARMATMSPAATPLSPYATTNLMQNGQQTQAWTQLRRNPLSRFITE